MATIMVNVDILPHPETGALGSVFAEFSDSNFSSDCSVIVSTFFGDSLVGAYIHKALRKLK